MSSGDEWATDLEGVAVGRSTRGDPAVTADLSASRVALGVCCGVSVVALAGVAVTLAVHTGQAGALGTLGPTAFLSGVLGAVLITLRRGNVVGWCFYFFGVMFTLGITAEQYAIEGLVTAPGSLPAAELALWLQIWVYPPALIPFAVLMPLYFPDGRLPSTRWRPVVWIAVALMAVLAALSAFTPGDAHLPGANLGNPYAVNAVGDLGAAAEVLPGLLWLCLVIAATTSLVRRFRSAGAVERAQVQWLAYALVLTATAFVVDAAVALLMPQFYPGVFPFIQVVSVVVPVAVTIAVLRYRLFDINRLINRTLLYGALTGCVIGIYVLIVGGLGVVFSTRPGTVALPLLATGVVAVGFAPLRDHLQRIIERLVYGDRADPYRALTLLGRRLEDQLALDGVLPTVAATVSDALRVPYVAVQVRGRRPVTDPDFTGDDFRTATEHGSPPAADTATIDVPLIYAGERVGRLVLAGRGRSHDLSAADRRVLGDLGRQIGVAVHGSEVEQQARLLAAELQRSRERLVLAREEERRRIGRDLHDGLGPQLAGLTMTIEAAHDLIRSDPQRAEELLSGLLGQADLAIGDVRRISHELRPPALDSLGLIGALRSHASSQRIPITVRAPEQLPALPAAVEVAAYRITLEAVRNVVLHAHAATCCVTLWVDGTGGRSAALHLEVTDTGIGPPIKSVGGVGLASMAERAAELGGSFTIEPGRTRGTRVEAILPIPTPEAGYRSQVPGR